MESVAYTTDRCEGCTDRVVCYCLQVTEASLLHAVNRMELRTLSEVRRCTGAGDGCTSCHRRIKQLLNQSR
jgi:NAD(P)H-nitrite reductase large subunit